MDHIYGASRVVYSIFNAHMYIEKDAALLSLALIRLDTDYQ